MIVKVAKKLFVTLILVFGNGALADVMPNCMASGQTLAVNNSQIIQWKSTTPNEFRSRGHIQGNLLRVYPDQTGHHHYEVQIGANTNDKIEVIYNEDFGAIPEVAPGSTVEACGDYITSNQRSGSLRPSPDGAILHWVHQAPNANHDSGYLAIDGTVYGQEQEHGHH